MRQKLVLYQRMKRESKNDARRQNSYPVLKNLWVIAQGLVVVAAYLYVLGFYTYTVRLGKATSITSANVNPQQYLTWGVLVVVYYVLTLRYLLLPAALVFVIWLYVFAEIHDRTKRMQPVQALVQTWMLLTQSVLGYVLAALIVMTLFLAGGSPDTLFTSSTGPRRVVLIFKEDVNPVDWKLTLAGKSLRRTNPLVFLDEYNDAILVRDERTGVAVEVKTDMLAGIDDEPFSNATTTATPVLTVTPTFTPTP